MITIVSFIFVLGILVFVHEFGHFIVAKRTGIKVEEFSLGFPPKMIGKKIGETEYRISWIPLGGYVKMAGENPEEELKGEPWEFMSKPVIIRTLVVSAGPIMNFLLAIFIFWGIFFFQGLQEVHTDKRIIGSVAKGGPAERAGIKAGDEILSINGKKTGSFEQMAGLIQSEVGKPIEIVWKRGVRRLRVTSQEEIVWRRGEDTLSATVLTIKEEVLDDKGNKREVGKIGIGPAYTIKKVRLFGAFWEGAKTTIFILKETIKFIFALIIGAASLKMLGGPVFIAQVAGESAKHGFASLLFFTALLSVNLSLLNILPIPALDGGHLLFLVIEKLKGKPLSVKYRAIMQQIGFALLVLLIIMVTYNDILRALK
ncbi:MAG: RIP metalloprotease RseP [candidate division Zixibacteria bacterium]|nr:RIP metalloprotease RseP [candidate division Zixibacteria bacterium]